MPLKTCVELSLVIPVRPSNWVRNSLDFCWALPSFCFPITESTIGWSAPDCSIAISAGALDSGPACSNGLCQFSATSMFASVSGASTVFGSVLSVLPQASSPILATSKKLAIRCGDSPSHSEDRVFASRLGMFFVVMAKKWRYREAAPFPRLRLQGWLDAHLPAHAHGLHAAHHRSSRMALHARLADGELLLGGQAHGA